MFGAFSVTQVPQDLAESLQKALTHKYKLYRATFRVRKTSRITEIIAEGSTISEWQDEVKAWADGWLVAKQPEVAHA
jgi:hypothetical protein